MNKKCKSLVINSFILIELLIVVAIIAILAGMLLPALNKARAAAQKTDCLSNIGQLGKVLLMYADDNSDYIPPCKFNDSIPWSATFIFGDYVTNRKNLICPSTSNYLNISELMANKYNDTASRSNPWECSWTTYGINPAISRNWLSDGMYKTTKSMKIGKAKHPSTTTAFADSRNYENTDMRGSFYFRWHTSKQRIEDRHSGSGNIVWLDGHAGSMLNACQTIGIDDEGNTTSMKKTRYMNPYY